MKHIGVGVGAFILNEHNELLLVRRKKEPEAAHWSLPGGKVELMETIEDATVREIKEELGVTIELKRLLCVTNHILPSATHFVAPTFVAHITEGNITNREPHASSEVGYFALTQLPTPLTVTTLNALKEFKHD